MIVTTHKPSVAITLTKNIYRSNGVSSRVSQNQDSLNWLDVTRFLGDSGEVTITKSIYAPAGTFVLRFVDRGAHNLDTLYGLLEPMDHIEIFAARNPHEYGAGSMPMLMSGFIRQVRRSETMTANGTPERSVIVTGTDYGAVFDLYKVFMFKNLITAEKMMEKFSTQYLLKQEARPYRADEFMGAWVDLVNGEYLDPMYESTFQNGAGGFNYRIQKDLRVTDSMVSNLYLDQHEGAIWSAMIRNADTPWNELFVESRATGPTLVYRPAPWLDLNGDWILKGRAGVGVGVEFVPVTAEDLVRMDVARSDAHVFNLFKIDAPRITYETQSSMAQAALNANSPNVYIKSHQNCDPKMYGDRLTIAETAHVPTGWSGRSTGDERATWEANSKPFAHFIEQRRAELAAMNLDNVVLEDGSMMLKGNERIRPGHYVRMQRGSLVADYYAHSVTHRFVPFRSFTTSVQFIRGTGFVARNRLQQAPHLAERFGGDMGAGGLWSNLGDRIDYSSAIAAAGVGIIGELSVGDSGSSSSTGGWNGSENIAVDLAAIALPGLEVGDHAVIVAHWGDEALWSIPLVGGARHVVCAGPATSSVVADVAARLYGTSKVRTSFPLVSNQQEYDGWKDTCLRDSTYTQDMMRDKIREYAQETGVKALVCHNPWGEMGDPNHVMIYNACVDVAIELNLSVWFNSLAKAGFWLKEPPENNSFWTENIPGLESTAELPVSSNDVSHILGAYKSARSAAPENWWTTEITFSTSIPATRFYEAVRSGEVMAPAGGDAASAIDEIKAERGLAYVCY